MIALLTIGCGDKDTTDTDSTAAGDLSECAQEIMDADAGADVACVDGDLIDGPCLTCSYWKNSSDQYFPDGWVTCSGGHEIDVEHGDCTGYCVPSGTALDPIFTSDGEPDFKCIRGE